MATHEPCTIKDVRRLEQPLETWTIDKNGDGIEIENASYYESVYWACSGPSHPVLMEFDDWDEVKAHLAQQPKSETK